MDFFTSDAFVTIVSVVASVAGLHLALRADIGKRIDRLEKRTKEGFQALEERIAERHQTLEDSTKERHQAFEDSIKERHQAFEERTKERHQALHDRIGRLEERNRADHQALAAEVSGLATEIGGLKASVSALGAKLDERSVPRALVVQEEPRDGYSVGDEAKGGPEPREDESGRGNADAGEGSQH